MAPTVSIILPTFNRLKYLPATIESVFGQTLGDWELIIADDGSDADTKAYLKTLCEEPRVKLIWLSHTGRPGVVRNAALREAKGEFIAFLDSDDIWLAPKLATQITSLRSHPVRSWSHTKYVLVDESLQPTAWAVRTGGWPTPQGWIFDTLLKSEAVIALPSVVTARALLEEVRGFDEDLIGCEDFDLCLRLATRSEIDAVEEPLTLVRRHEDHFSGGGAKAFVHSRRVLEKVLRRDDIEHLRPMLLARRAEIATHLARSHAAAGNRVAALGAVLESAHYSWRYAHWWRGVVAATARAFTPDVIWKFARSCRNGHYWRRKFRIGKP